MFIPKYFFLFFILFFPIALLSQERPGGLDENTEIPEKTKSQISSEIKIWNLAGNGAFIKDIKLDTLQDEIQIYDPIYKNTITNTYTGNYGGAYLNNNFFSRKYNTDFFFSANS